eukprot:SAG22_NODE_828_length_6952_cov_8.477240_3_plen_116_part_00
MCSTTSMLRPLVPTVFLIETCFHRSPLSALTSLTTLYLSENRITDIAPLSTLTSLWELELGNNQITDITPLSALTSLAILGLRDAPLSALTSLEGLGLGENLSTFLISSDSIKSF